MLCGTPPPVGLLEGIEQFNRGEYFEQHETLETLWREQPDDVRYLYQGILQVGVGLHHLGRGNYRGTVSRLEAGIEKLSSFAPRCQGVDVARLIADSARCLETVRTLGRDRLGEFDWKTAPRIDVDERSALQVEPPGTA